MSSFKNVLSSILNKSSEERKSDNKDAYLQNLCILDKIKEGDKTYINSKNDTIKEYKQLNAEQKKEINACVKDKKDNPDSGGKCPKTPLCPAKLQDTFIRMKCAERLGKDDPEDNSVAMLACIKTEKLNIKNKKLSCEELNKLSQGAFDAAKSCVQLFAYGLFIWFSLTLISFFMSGIMSLVAWPKRGTFIHEEFDSVNKQTTTIYKVKNDSNYFYTPFEKTANDVNIKKAYGDISGVLVEVIDEKNIGKFKSSINPFNIIRLNKENAWLYYYKHEPWYSKKYRIIPNIEKTLYKFFPIGFFLFLLYPLGIPIALLLIFAWFIGNGVLFFGECAWIFKLLDIFDIFKEKKEIDSLDDEELDSACNGSDLFKAYTKEECEAEISKRKNKQSKCGCPTEEDLEKENDELLHRSTSKSKYTSTGQSVGKKIFDGGGINSSSNTGMATLLLATI